MSIKYWQEALEGFVESGFPITDQQADLLAQYIDRDIPLRGGARMESMLKTALAEVGVTLTDEQFAEFVESISISAENYELVHPSPSLPPEKASPAPAPQKRKLTKAERAARKAAFEREEKILFDAIADIGKELRNRNII